MGKFTSRWWCTFLLLILSLPLAAQKNYTDVQDLTLGGKIFATANPYDRIDPVEGMTPGELSQARLCSGLWVAFDTNSKTIGVRVVWSVTAGNGGNNGPIAARGFDLYIKKDGSWLWAGNGFTKKNTPGEEHEVTLIPDSGHGAKQCLVYLPLGSRIESMDIVTDEGSWIESCAAPFRRRIAVFGSSYTNGSGAGRCAMTWTAQLSRQTGLNFMNFGFSGNCKLQSYFARALAGADVDAYVFDAFSNPSPGQVEERLEPFIQILQKARPGVPLIFIQTIYREKRNFSDSYNEREIAKRETAERMMQAMTAKYKHIYWVNTTNATSESHETTSDGSHPDSYGYTLWAESVKDPILKILHKYEKD